jgi:hypothetical protein
VDKNTLKHPVEAKKGAKKGFVVMDVVKIE